MTIFSIPSTSMRVAIAIALIACVLSAALEGVFAGPNVKATFARLDTPRFSPSLRTWIVIGVAYYVLFFAIVVRVLRVDHHDTLRTISLVLALKLMFINALWNLLFFRLRSPLLSFVLGIPYGLLAIALCVCLVRLDRPLAGALTLYLVYLCYASYWGYAVWKLNVGSREGSAAQ